MKTITIIIVFEMIADESAVDKYESSVEDVIVSNTLLVLVCILTIEVGEDVISSTDEWVIFVIEVVISKLIVLFKVLVESVKLKR